MDPQRQFCHNPDCSERGVVGGGNIGSTVGRRSGTSVGGASGPFAATSDTPFYRLHKPAELAVLVLTLLSHGCPTQAIVAAFGLDERTVARWLASAGRHCQRVHEHLVEQGQVDLQHVQADELWVKQVGGKVWMALALAVPSRLWLGGVISRQRDLPLITRLVQRVRACAVTPAILVCVDGLASYVTAFLKVFRQPIHTGRRGRPRLVLPGRVPVRPGRQALGQAARRRRHPPGRSRHPGGHRGGPDGDGHRHRHQHRLHRAPQRHLPRPPRAAHPTRSRHRPHRGGPHRRDVAGRHRLQLLLAPRQPAPARSRPRSSEVAPPHPSHGGRAHRPLLDPRRVAPLPDPLTSLGPTQTTRPAAQTSASWGGRMTTVPWGATRQGA